MHLGKRFTLLEYVVWTREEIAILVVWSAAVTAAFELVHHKFTALPTPVLALIGTAVAFVLAFKNQQCYARVTEALALWGQINSASLILANKLVSAAGREDPHMRQLFLRHFAWLTAMRFFLREPKVWENTHERGNERFLATLPTPESRSSLKEELSAYLPEAEAAGVLAHRGDKEALLLHRQYGELAAMRDDKRLSDVTFRSLTDAVDDLFRLQGACKRLKNYPYARNYYSIAVLLVKAFVAIVPLSLYSYAQGLGASEGLERWTVWLNVPFSVAIGWIYVTLEKVGENSANPFEGGPNDVPISFLSRRIEIEMRQMLGEATTLKPIEAKYGIMF